METKEILSEFYGHYDENGRLLSPHGQVEFITTMKYVEKYLRPGMHILEIGAGTGRYSHALARQGYRVDAVELVESNIAIFRQNTQPGEDIRILQGDARNLGDLGIYDITLLLGPMYHLFTQEDKEQALREAVRVTKPGGVIFTAYCMADPSILSHGFIAGHIHSLLEKNMLDPETFTAFSDPSDLFALYRKEDIDALRAKLPVTPLHFVAADGFTNYMRDTIAAMDEETFAIYLKYHLTVCERQELVGYSHHTLDIVQKSQQSSESPLFTSHART